LELKRHRIHGLVSCTHKCLQLKLAHNAHTHTTTLHATSIAIGCIYRNVAMVVQKH